MGFPDTSFRHVFGDLIPRASDGALLLGKMSAHTANAGRVYFPGGAIDESDVFGDGIDIDHNITREMEEELGLDLGLGDLDLDSMGVDLDVERGAF